MKKTVFKAFLSKKRKECPSTKIIDEKKRKEKKRIKLGPWDDEEDKILDEWVKKHGPQKWTKCAELIKERTGKQCREHWNNKLKSNLTKGNWTSEEDLLIMRFYVKYKSWKKIIPIFEDRAENSIKNRFFSQLRKIAVNKQDPENKEYGIKIKLNRLTQFIDEAYREAEDRYFNENKNMTKEDFEEYISKIEQELNNKEIKKKNIIKYIDLKSIKNNIIANKSNSQKNKSEEHNKTKYEHINKDENIKNYKDINNIEEKITENKTSGLLARRNFLENMNNFYSRNIRNNNALKEDIEIDDEKSENISRIISSEDKVLTINEELKEKYLNNDFEMYLLTTKNIDKVKKGKYINLKNINN